MPQKPTTGFTLLEAVIAVALWLILSVAVLNIWGSASVASATALTRHNAFENARIAVDVLAVNIQLADEIDLSTVSVAGIDVLNTLRLRQISDMAVPPSRHHWYVLTFTRHNNRLNFSGNELASGLASIEITISPEELMYIKITTEELPGGAITLTSVVDIRGKVVV